MKTPHEKLVTSARNAVKAILRMDIEEKHRRRLLDVRLWAITEVPGKYKVRYITLAARKKRTNKYLRHEHVYPRKWLIDRLLSSPRDINKIMKCAVACVVTKSENSKLNKGRGVGWKRYERLNIPVWDRVKKRRKV